MVYMKMEIGKKRRKRKKEKKKRKIGNILLFK